MLKFQNLIDLDSIFLKKSRFQIRINLYCLMTLIMSVRNGECY